MPAAALAVELAKVWVPKSMSGTGVSGAKYVSAEWTSRSNEEAAIAVEADGNIKWNELIKVTAEGPSTEVGEAFAPWFEQHAPWTLPELDDILSSADRRACTNTCHGWDSATPLGAAGADVADAAPGDGSDDWDIDACDDAHAWHISATAGSSIV